MTEAQELAHLMERVAELEKGSFVGVANLFSLVVMAILLAIREGREWIVQLAGLFGRAVVWVARAVTNWFRERRGIYVLWPKPGEHKHQQRTKPTLGAFGWLLALAFFCPVVIAIDNHL